MNSCRIKTYKKGSWEFQKITYCQNTVILAFSKLIPLILSDLIDVKKHSPLIYCLKLCLSFIPQVSFLCYLIILLINFMLYFIDWHLILVKFQLVKFFSFIDLKEYFFLSLLQFIFFMVLAEMKLFFIVDFQMVFIVFYL